MATLHRVSGGNLGEQFPFTWGKLGAWSSGPDKLGWVGFCYLLPILPRPGAGWPMPSSVHNSGPFRRVRWSR
jgi:hypothetical protein